MGLLIFTFKWNSYHTVLCLVSKILMRLNSYDFILVLDFLNSKYSWMVPTPKFTKKFI